MERKSYKVSKVAAEGSEQKTKAKKITRKDSIKISLRWPNWVRDQVYKHIATQILTGKIGVTRAQGLSPQQFVVLACAEKLGMNIVEEAESPASENAIAIFLQLLPPEVHAGIDSEVDRLKNFDPKMSINKWILEAVKEKLNK